MTENLSFHRHAQEVSRGKFQSRGCKVCTTYLFSTRQKCFHSFSSRARKEEKASAEKERKNKEIEDAKWRDDDKNLQKKMAKKEEVANKVAQA